MSAKDAYEIALSAVLWLTEDMEHLSGFLSESGAALEDLRTAGTDPAIAGAVLDYLLSNEPLLVAFCDKHSIRYETIAFQRQHLPGGGLPNWT